MQPKKLKTIAKSWGETTTLLQDKSFSVHLATARAMKSCSVHFHDCKTNCFFVISGQLEVASSAKVYTLGPGDFLEVPPGRIHQFRALSPATFIEVYYSRALPSDITRLQIKSLIEKEEASA